MAENHRRIQDEPSKQSARRRPVKRTVQGETTPVRKKKKKGLTAGKVIGTVVLVGVLTVAIFIGIFMGWVRSSLKGNVEIYIDEFESSVSTELYYQDTDTNEWVMYQTLFMEGEDRIWAGMEDIPKYLRDAAVAIEDKRFERHHGVDWIGTLRAVVFTLGPGDSLQGGSTITQQLIKNMTGDSQTTVKRKITEIYRALEMETRYDKDEILEAYLNEIYLGRSCYGVQSASLRYFGKDVNELDLAECASLVSVTNNPSMFGPLESDWSRENNRNRQVLVLQAMLDQEKISQEEYDRAYAEEIVFTNGYTNMGNYVTEHLEDQTDEEEADQKPVSTAWNSYFTDAVIDDVANALVEELGLTDYSYTDKDGVEHTTSARSQAVNMVYGKGYKIYTTQNAKYQEIAENIFEDVSNAPYTTGNNEQLQGAITVVDPYTGYVVAMVGGIGAKTTDRGWNWATEPRPCGSAAKPITTYAPALDNGTLTAASTLDDYPAMLLNNTPWPKNDHAGFYGLSTVRTAIVKSLNTCAVRACMEYGVGNSYNFMVDKLGFTTLTATDAQQVGNMALGGFDRGVTTEEMASAYASFANEGIYTKPRTFVRVEDANGNVILENEANSHVAMKSSTAAIMNSMLQQVITGGTGGSAYFSGMHIAGKTGTTNDLRDRYFVGYSPYYCAACWVGYESNSVVSSGGINPAAVLWQKVMSEIHADLEDKDFFSSSDLVTVTVCADSGMLATTACEMDPRGSRVRTEICAVDNQPTQYCTMHSGFGMLDYTRENFVDFPDIVADDDPYVRHMYDFFGAIQEWFEGDTPGGGIGGGIVDDIIDDITGGDDDPGGGEEQHWGW